jgi:hypothetical protein
VSGVQVALGVAATVAAVAALLGLAVWVDGRGWAERQREYARREAAHRRKELLAWGERVGTRTDERLRWCPDCRVAFWGERHYDEGVLRRCAGVQAMHSEEDAMCDSNARCRQDGSQADLEEVWHLMHDDKDNDDA